MKEFQVSRTARAVCLLAPLAAVLTAAVVRAQGTGRDSSVLPPAAAPAVAPPAAPAGDPRSTLPGSRVASPRLQLRSVRIGAEPYAWAAPGQAVKSFITNDPRLLEVAAEARISGRTEPAGKIEWEITPPVGFQVPEDAELTGPTLRVRLVRELGNSTGAGAPLSLTLSAVDVSDRKHLQASITVTQDLRDRLRQEYVDLERAEVPARKDMLDEDQFRRAYGKKYPDVTFAELNFSKQPDNEERYPVILAAESLVRTVQQLRAEYPLPVTLSSGFRNPVRQVEVHAVVGESHHQYGRAADLSVAPDSAPPKNGRTIAYPGDWLRLAAACLRAGGVWIEPMTECHVYTAGCHVHVDVREAGVQSRLVKITGVVTAADGLAVPGATVRLAGMEVLTNAVGAYELKHVLTPREYPLEVALPQHEPITRTVLVGETGAVASVRLPVGMQAQAASRIVAPADSSVLPTTPVPSGEALSAPAPPSRTPSTASETHKPPAASPQSALALAAAGAALAGAAAGAAMKTRPRLPREAKQPPADPSDLPPTPGN